MGGLVVYAPMICANPSCGIASCEREGARMVALGTTNNSRLTRIIETLTGAPAQAVQKLDHCSNRNRNAADIAAIVANFPGAHRRLLPDQKDYFEAS